MTTILKVLVGSRAHGLADDDYRGVWVRPTSELLALGAKPQTTQWTEADKARGEKLDDTSWEVGHFLQLATHCNPSVLEVFAAPVVEIAVPDGHHLRALFPYLWHPQGVRDAFIGYGLNQRKKFLDDKNRRAAKYAVAYQRVLWQAYHLLIYGVLRVDVRSDSAMHDRLLRWRRGAYTVGEVVECCVAWEGMVRSAADRCDHRQDLGPVNDYLLDLRRRRW